MKQNKWLIIWVSFLGAVSLALAMNKVAPCVVLLMEYFDTGMATTGWLTSVFALMGMAAALPSAVILNRLGPKKTGLLALAFAIAGALIGVFSRSVFMLMISRIIEGFGVGVIAVTASSLITMWFPAHKRGLPMGILGSWMMVGQSVMFFSAGFIILHFSWRGMWLLPLAFTAVIAVLYFFIVEGPPKGHNHADAQSENFSLWAGVKCKNAWLLAVVSTCFGLSSFGFVTWIAPYWSETFAWHIDAANRWVSIIYFLEILMVVGIGWLLDRVPNRKTLGLVAFSLYALVLCFSFRINDPGLILPFVILYPLLEGTLPVVFWTIAPQTVPRAEMASVALGILNVGFNLGAIIGPPLTGAIIETYSWRMGTVPITISALIGLAALMRVKIYDHVTPGTMFKKN